MSQNDQKDSSGPSPYVLSMMVDQQLDLLNYTVKFPRHGPFYFVNANVKNKSEQIKAFVKIVLWLLNGQLNLQLKEPDLYLETPIQYANQICNHFEKLKIPIDPPMQIKDGFGLPVLKALDNLLKFVINQKNLKLGNPKFPQDLRFIEEQNVVKDSDFDNIIDANYDYTNEEEDEEFYFEGTEGQNAVAATPQIMETEIDADQWKIDLEEASPHLILRLNADHKDWRTHVDSMKKQQGTIANLYDQTVQTLSKISEEITKVVDRINKRESVLSQDHNIHVLLQQYKNAQDKLDTLTKKYKTTEENIGALSNQVKVVDQELSELKKEVDLLSKKMGDPTPLREIKEAQRKIRNEIREMGLRTGMLRGQVLHPPTARV